MPIRKAPSYSLGSTESRFVNLSAMGSTIKLKTGGIKGIGSRRPVSRIVFSLRGIAAHTRNTIRTRYFITAAFLYLFEAILS